MSGSTPRFFRSVLRPASRLAGWVAVGGLLLAAALWASEPGGADPPASSWRAGRTSTTWDWERHWNYWMEWECAEQGYLPGGSGLACLTWSRVGPIWKACGPVIRPPDSETTNSCNIGQTGGHAPHGDTLNSKYTYLGQHEDRTGPTYPLCVGDSGLPADTSPGNCGTWVITPHQHCPDDPSNHPPDCLDPDTTSTFASTSASSSSTSSTSTTRVRPTTTRPPVTPNMCEEPEGAEAFYDAVEDQPTPGLGIQPTARGYVRVPMRAFYTRNPRTSLSVRIEDERVYLRLWVSQVSWSFTDLGTLDGVDLGNRTFHRYAADRSAARRLTDPVTVKISGQTVVYRRSSLRAGRPSGYRITLTVVWSAQCRQSGKSGWVDLDEETRRYRHTYPVYAIWSRPD